MRACRVEWCLERMVARNPRPGTKAGLTNESTQATAVAARGTPGLSRHLITSVPRPSCPCIESYLCANQQLLERHRDGP
jgi:hypothetical protein